MARSEELQIEFLYRALAEAQDTLRFADAKAGTIVILVGGLLAFLGAIHGRIDTVLLQALATAGLGSMLLAALCSVWALRPRLNPDKFIDLAGVDVAPLYYVGKLPSMAGWRALLSPRGRNWLALSAAEYLARLEGLDAQALRNILVYELLKVSFIREEKAAQLTLAIRFMQAAGGALAVLVACLYLAS